MREFIEQYRLLLEDRYEEEARADFDAWHETPEFKSPLPFEKKMSPVYTHEISKKFQVEENQCSTTSKDVVSDPHLTGTYKAPGRIDAGKGKEDSESNAFKKGKLPQSATVSVDSQDSFHLMEMCDLRPTQSHDIVPPQLQNMVPIVFQSITSLEFHNMALSYLPEARLPQ
ncbi:hypothetical protein RCOM_0963740 [Ricinus communis]|uniref:Protein FAR1-RELATED SEQUENCE n=1 Tax=Ricinus communis TaxID=3988 RepID=B9RVJ7_RICCO|nr:hypothetical protein RCOM_0963740 [Ricinus communis]